MVGMGRWEVGVSGEGGGARWGGGAEVGVSELLMSKAEVSILYILR